ncbi:hypothetical protein [Methylocella sp.]
MAGRRSGCAIVVEHEADVAGPYMTKEAAFEAAVASAGTAIAQGMKSI